MNKLERCPVQYVYSDAYFDVFESVLPELEEEIDRVLAAHPALSIDWAGSGQHDRGWRYETFRIASRRNFDPAVQQMAKYLHGMSCELFRQCLPGDADRVDLF